MITYYAKTASSVTTAVGTGTVSIGTFDSSMTAYMADVTSPTAITDCLGATWLKAGAVAVALAATIY